MSKLRTRVASIRPLDAILGTRAKLAVLRLLASSPVPLSCQAMSRRAGMAYRSIDLAVRDLMGVGLLERIGESHERMYATVETHRLVPAIKGLLRAESDFRPALRAELAAVSRREAGAVAVAIVGSGGPPAEGIGDPVHVVVVTESEETVRQWGDRFVAAGDGLLDRFGIRLRVTVYSHATMARMWATRTAAAERSVATAERVAGVRLQDLVEGNTAIVSSVNMAAADMFATYTYHGGADA